MREIINVSYHNTCVCGGGTLRIHSCMGKVCHNCIYNKPSLRETFRRN